MKFITAMLFLAIGALASPVAPETPAVAEVADAMTAQDAQLEPYSPCKGDGLFGLEPTCCAVDILGAAALGCTPRKYMPEKRGLASGNWTDGSGSRKKSQECDRVRGSLREQEAEMLFSGPYSK